MIRKVIFINDCFKNVDFENLSHEELCDKGFTKGVVAGFNHDTEFDIEHSIEMAKKICSDANSTLAVVYEYEEDKQVSFGFYNLKQK